MRFLTETLSGTRVEWVQEFKLNFLQDKALFRISLIFAHIVIRQLFNSTHLNGDYQVLYLPQHSQNSVEILKLIHDIRHLD